MSGTLEESKDAEVTEAKESKPPVDTIPDGGVIAWLQVLGSFFLFFNSW